MLLPQNRHDWAIWLFDHLEGVTPWTETLYRGTLPLSFNFAEIESAIAENASNLCGLTDATTREIEFHPESGHVYAEMDRLLANPKNREAPPSRFTLRDISYTSGDSQVQPEIIKRYVAATRLWALVKEMADYDQDSGNLQNFIESYDSRLGLRLTYHSGDLRSLPDLNAFISEFREADTHKRQKRNIFRSTLIGAFKGQSTVPFAEMLANFAPFVESARNSYTMYAADFSFEKVVEAVDRQNLEDTLRLNRIFADLQNQLLALPAALLFAGASLQPGETIRSVAVVLGVLIFAIFMWLLVANQLNSLEAIGLEINLRKDKLRELPAKISDRFSGAFVALKERKENQDRVLKGVRFSAAGVFLIVLLMALCSK